MQEIVKNWHRHKMSPYELALALARLHDANGYSQRDLAREIGTSAQQISKVLSLLKLDPAVQTIAREDCSGRLTRCHLYAIRNLRPEEQLELIRRAQSEALTAVQTEHLAAKRRIARLGRRRRRRPPPPYTFETTKAVVRVTFRRKGVTQQDVVAALENTLRQIESAMPKPTAD